MVLTQTEVFAKQKLLVETQQKAMDLQHELQTDANTKKLAQIAVLESKLKATPVPAEA